MLTKKHGIYVISRPYCWTPDGDGEGSGGGSGGGDGGGSDGDGNKGGGDGGGDKGGSSGGDAGGDGGNEPPDNANWDEKTKSYISNLRKENAKYRTKSKNLEDQIGSLNERFTGMQEAMKKAFNLEDGSQLTPEQQVEVLGGQLEQAGLQNQIMLSAIENGVGKDSFDYYQFLLSKRIDSLEEGEELGDDDLQEIAQEARSKTAPNPAGNSTSVGGGDNGGRKPKPGDSDGITADQFARMSITEKSQVYQKTPELYSQLMIEAKNKHLL